MTKKRVLIALAIIAALIAALAVAFCLWYTRPRTFDDLLDGRTVTDLAAVGTHGSNDNGTARSDSYTLNQSEQGKAAAQGFVEVLADSRYRARLRSALPPPSSYSSPISIQVVMILDDGSTLLISVLDREVLFSGDGFPSVAAGDKDLAMRLYTYLAEYGVEPEAREQLLFE